MTEGVDSVKCKTEFMQDIVSYFSSHLDMFSPFLSSKNVNI